MDDPENYKVDYSNPLKKSFRKTSQYQSSLHNDTIIGAACKRMLGKVEEKEKVEEKVESDEWRKTDLYNSVYYKIGIPVLRTYKSKKTANIVQSHLSGAARVIRYPIS